MTNIIALTAHTANTFCLRPLTPSLNGCPFDAVRETISSQHLGSMETTFNGEPVMLWFDDNAALADNPVDNPAAMQMFQALAGEQTPVKSRVFGECVFTGFDPDTREPVALPRDAVTFMLAKAETISARLPVAA